MYSRQAGRDAVAAAGQLQAVRDVEDDRHALLAHHRERAHVDDQVVVAEAGAALGDEDARVARVDDLGDRVPHVVGREELALLDVDDAAGLRRGDEQVGLPQRNAGICSTSATSAAGAACDGSWMSVRIGTPSRALIAAEDAQAFVEARARGTIGSDVRFALSYDALKMNGTPQRARDRRERVGEHRARAPRSR